MRQMDDFPIYFDVQAVDEIWDHSAVLQVFHYDSKNLSQYVSGYKVTLPAIVHLRVT